MRTNKAQPRIYFKYRRVLMYYQKAINWMSITQEEEGSSNNNRVMKMSK